MSKKPNIVFIVMDTSRADNLSCYGCEDKTTPFLDSLAESGVKYERAISQAVWTMPSHASMFTGKYQYQHRVTKGEGDDLRDLDMLQSDLSERGYETIGVVNVPFLWPKFGFDEYFDRYDYINSDYLSKSGILDGLEGANSNIGKFVKALRAFYAEGGVKSAFKLSNYLIREILLLNDSGADKTNKVALNHLKEVEEPFFLFINYLEVHGPYSPPFPYSHMFLEDKKKWLSLTSLSSLSPYARRYIPGFYSKDIEVDEEELKTMRDLYKGEQRYLDKKIEELYKSIKDEFPNTVFVVTSDHGEAFGEHNHFEHFGSLHDEVARVPLIEDFPEEFDRTVEYQVETRQIHDHLIDIADGGGLRPIEENGPAITEYPGRELSDNPHFEENNLIYDFTRDSVSVEKDGKKIIRGYSRKNMVLGPDFREKEGEEHFFQDLESKAGSILDKLKIFT